MREYRILENFVSEKTVGFGHHPEPLLIVISGPSGVGKDSVVLRLKERANIPFHFVVTTTTRAPRDNEVDGVDYCFCSEAEFEQMIADDELLEHAWVYAQYKGVPKSQVREALASGKDVVMRLDVQGAATIKEKASDAILIFITTDTEEELIERLIRRKTETPEGLKLRIETTRQEYQRLKEFDYVVVNRDGALEEAVDMVEAIIAAEHHRTEPRKVNL